MPVLRANLLLALTAFIWGSAFVAQRVGMEHMGPMTFNAIRFALGTLLLLPLALRPGSGLLTRRDLALGMGVGAVLFAGSALQQIGLVWTSATNAAFLTGLYVPLVPILGLALGQRVHWSIWPAVALAVCGMYLLSTTSGLHLRPGDAAEIGGAVFWALHVLALGSVGPRVDVFRLASLQYLACALLSAAAALLYEHTTLGAVRAAAIPIAYGSVLSIAVAYTLQVIAQRHTPAAHAALLLSLETVFAALCGWLVLGETLSARGMVGCAAMLGGILGAQLLPLLPRRHKRTSQQATDP